MFSFSLYEYGEIGEMRGGEVGCHPRLSVKSRNPAPELFSVLVALVRPYPLTATPNQSVSQSKHIAISLHVKHIGYTTANVILHI